MENTARIHIMGAAAVLVSGVKLEDWKQVEKYTPEALTVTDDETGETVFQVACGEGGGSMTKEGVAFGVHVSEEGNATVTILLDGDVDDPLEAVTDVTGTALLELIEIEKGMPELLEQIREKREKIREHIVRI